MTAQVLRLPGTLAEPAKEEHFIKDGKVKIFKRVDHKGGHWSYRFKPFLRDGEKRSDSKSNYTIKTTGFSNLDDAKRFAARCCGHDR